MNENDRQGETRPKKSPKTESRPPVTGLLTLPNQLTIARLVLSVVFFVLLGLVGHGVFEDTSLKIALDLSAALFVFAVLTDFLDGHLARRWGLVTTFGRIADPFADKILICGGFIMLIGVSPMIEPWFVVVIVFREFLVSGLRSFLESRGVAFGAVLSGKLKMGFQSVTVPAVLVYQAHCGPALATGRAEGGTAGEMLRVVTITLLVLTLLFTVVSGVSYLRRGILILRQGRA